MFGLVTVLQGFTQNYSGILATRFFLGNLSRGSWDLKFVLICPPRPLRERHAPRMLLSHVNVRDLDHSASQPQSPRSNRSPDLGGTAGLKLRRAGLSYSPHVH